MNVLLLLLAFLSLGALFVLTNEHGGMPGEGDDGAVPVWEQASFRIGEDDGSETTATWIAAINTNNSASDIDFDSNFRVRFLIKETAGVAETNFLEQIQVNWASGGYTNVAASGTGIVWATSSNYADNSDTTTGARRLGSGTFVTTNRAMTETDYQGAGNSPDMAGADEFECEFCLQINSVVANTGESGLLRIVKSATVLDTYTNIPTIFAPATSTESKRVMVIS